MSFRVKALIRLRHMEIIFFICRHVNDFIGHDWIVRIGAVDLAVRRLNKSVFIDPRVACQ